MSRVSFLSVASIFSRAYKYFIFCCCIRIVHFLIYTDFCAWRNRAGEFASTAYVTFKYAHALETAVLLNVSFDVIVFCKAFSMNIGKHSKIHDS